ncbi:amidase family protein [uncultured Variovorax sp.]|uniref:amidase family protein n=1 Tax=uncultured Variovorax sp. TaxID=114708 RepID=UPI0025E4E83E|nr:amidase family protein [uncultured Variovorax sp.]
MNRMHALTDLSAREAAGLMRQGDLRASDYARALLDRAAEISAYGAFLHLDPPALLAAAELLDASALPAPGTRPLHGVPLAFKDNIDVAGMPTTAGSPWMADHRPSLHAGVTQRLLDAGALVLGKSNLHEWSQGVTGHNHGFGPSRNPFDPTRVTGGSSGGNAALLGLRAAPAAIGTDTGGSVRVPAALCGLTGFRPTVHRWPDDGLVPISPTFDTAGVMARCVDDCVLVDHAVAGGPAQLAATSLAGVRLGVPQACFWEELDPPVEKLARESLGRLATAGAVLVPCDLSEADALFRAGSMTISLFEILPALAAYFARHARPFDARALADAVVSPDVRPLFERLFGDTAVAPEAYARALHMLRPRMQAAYRDCFARHGLAALVFPTSPLTAARIGEDVEVMLCGRTTTAFSAYIRNTGPAGMAGLPALSLPMGLACNGLPAGLELTGAEGTDSALLALALGIEAVLPRAPVAAAARPAPEER